MVADRAMPAWKCEMQSREPAETPQHRPTQNLLERKPIGSKRKGESYSCGQYSHEQLQHSRKTTGRYLVMEGKKGRGCVCRGKRRQDICRRELWRSLWRRCREKWRRTRVVR